MGDRDADGLARPSCFNKAMIWVNTVSLGWKRGYCGKARELPDDFVFCERPQKWRAVDHAMVPADLAGM